MTNPLVEIMKLGRSVWYDNIRRAMLVSGDLRKKIEQDDLRGVTSNPTIFEKAIIGSTDYDEQLESLVAAGKEVAEIYEELVLEDIASAADTLQPVHDRTDGIDLAAVTRKLQEDGLKAFVGSFDTLLESIEAKRDALRSGIHGRLTAASAAEALAAS